MSRQVVATLIALVCVLLPLSWCMPSQATQQQQQEATAMTRREIIKQFVARVQALIIELMDKLKALNALG
ncbi:uncharacterized protein LOC111076074 [Drosophila obscura]|uniref:uncharacterized protein LOC111076074 n=1 Tax=Drosophila obscura TaxID=7282 RepID=UPI001BB19F22|nr:uncharacterized protein LOC111076074 [Drosophila obscura]